MKTVQRIAVCGYSRHGKGEVAKLISRYSGLRYQQSTSQAAAQLVFNTIGRSYGYRDAEECFNDRHNHRKEWAETIWQYNQPDGLRLYREMLADNDVLEGIRKQEELAAVVKEGLVDTTVWVDASQREAVEPQNSCQVCMRDCEHVIDNNGSYGELLTLVLLFCEKLRIAV